MTPEIEALKKIATQKINKGKLKALQKVHSDAYDLSQKLQPKSTDEEDAEDFSSLTSDVEDALSELESAIDELDMAEEKDERDDAISTIEDGLEQTISAFDAIMPSAIIGTAPAPKAPDFDPVVTAKFIEIHKLPEQDRSQALTAWIQSAGTPALIEERRRKLDQLVSYIGKVRQNTGASQPS